MGRWYPLKLDMDDNDTFMVTARDFPEVTTYGGSQAEALVNARRAIEEAIAARIAAGEDIPHPLDELGRRGAFVEISILAYLKAGLYMVSREKGITRAEIARRMNVHREQVDRLFRLDHNSRMDQIEAAFRALDVHLRVEVPLGAVAA